MSRKPERPRSSRQLKVGEMLRQTLSEIFLRGDFYTADGKTLLLTISEVRVSPDLRNATVFVMPLGGENIHGTMKYLTDSTPKIRFILSKKVDLRFMPALYFKLDESYEQAHRINELLSSENVKRDLES